MPESTVAAKTFIPASVILQGIHDEAPVDNVTVGWLIGNLQNSFGLILLILALAAAAPGICLVAGLLVMIPAFQMAAGRSAPAFPRWISERKVPARRLGAALQRAVPALKFLERSIHPRWSIPHNAAKRVVGIVVIMLSLRLLLAPLPLSNILPALVIALISLAYLEQDGLVLLIGLLAGFVVLAVDAVVLWELVRGATSIGRLW